MFIEYDAKLIYQIFIENNYKIVQIKLFQIFKNANQKSNIEILIYETILAEKQGRGGEISRIEFFSLITPTLPKRINRGRNRP